MEEALEASYTYPHESRLSASPLPNSRFIIFSGRTTTLTGFEHSQTERRYSSETAVGPNPRRILEPETAPYIMSVVTTLGFNGQTEAALKLYEEALGAETIFLMRFRESPDQTHTNPGMEDLIFHATFRVLGTTLMASDVGYEGPRSARKFDGFALALRYRSVLDAQLAFDKLAVEGEVIVPLATSKFTSWYGVVVDRFGLTWKFNVDDGVEETS